MDDEENGFYGELLLLIVFVVVISLERNTFHGARVPSQSIVLAGTLFMASKGIHLLHITCKKAIVALALCVFSVTPRKSTTKITYFQILFHLNVSRRLLA